MNKLEIRKEPYTTRIIIRSELNVLIVDCGLLDNGHTLNWIGYGLFSY